VEGWNDYFGIIAQGLSALVATDRDGRDLPVAEGVRQWVAMTRAVQQRDAHLYIIGNGGSAGMASHMATDAAKNGRLRAVAFNDSSLLTATGNDLAYDQVFSLPLERLARSGDMLIAISSSGNSPNIVRALEVARGLGVATVTLTGMRADNKARALGDLNFYVPLSRYGWAESAHQVVLHYWFDQYQEVHGPGAI
jgi:D-sedoheptulose 7-phosphate isomerase